MDSRPVTTLRFKRGTPDADVRRSFANASARGWRHNGEFVEADGTRVLLLHLADVALEQEPEAAC